MSKSVPSEKPEPSPLGKFHALASRIVNLPKPAADEERKWRERKKSTGQKSE